MITIFFSPKGSHVKSMQISFLLTNLNPWIHLAVSLKENSPKVESIKKKNDTTRFFVDFRRKWVRLGWMVLEAEQMLV